MTLRWSSDAEGAWTAATAAVHFDVYTCGTREGPRWRWIAWDRKTEAVLAHGLAATRREAEQKAEESIA